VGIDERLAELEIELPAPTPPVASYVPVVVAGGFAFTAGQVALDGGNPLWTGAVGAEVDADAGARAAARCALQALSVLRAELGSLDRIRRVVRVGVFVASAPGFTAQSTVANGASDLLVQIFGEAGRHARTAVGVAELPLGAPVEVELTVQLADD
jgi:enamine deaminase RidA (YjgF/YER057c/UK114 family)